MNRLLIASSPVEIEAKAEEAGLPQPAREAALFLFHALTRRIGEATRALHSGDESMPAHRFYFGESGDAELLSILDGLQKRPDYSEVVEAEAAKTPNGLFAVMSRDGSTGLLVGHESHAGHSPPAGELEGRRAGLDPAAVARTQAAGSQTPTH